MWLSWPTRLTPESQFLLPHIDGPILADYRTLLQTILTMVAAIILSSMLLSLGMLIRSFMLLIFFLHNMQQFDNLSCKGCVLATMRSTILGCHLLGVSASCGSLKPLRLVKLVHVWPSVVSSSDGWRKVDMQEMDLGSMTTEDFDVTLCLSWSFVDSFLFD